MMRQRDIVILSTADWDNPFWTNKQHVAMELARLGHRVFYIDSLGLRRPTATARDAKRIFGRLLKACRPPRRVKDNLWVWSPIILPMHESPIAQKLNSWLLRASMCLWLTVLRLRVDILWTYNPLTDQFLHLSKYSLTVYHCVDEIKEQPGMPMALLARAEERLSKAADIIFVTSPALAASRMAWNQNTHYLPNVADFAHFSKARDPALRLPDDLAKIPGPILGFVGAISAYKVDLNLICQIAQAKPHWSIVLIGSVGEGDPWTDPQLLGHFANIHLLGARAYDDLPAYLKGFDVALMPNTLNEYTKSMFPMKFFEYLAAGKPVVSVDLNALQEFAHIACIAKDTAEFIDGIENALAGQGPSMKERLRVAERYTYKERTKAMMELIEASSHHPLRMCAQGNAAIPQMP